MRALLVEDDPELAMDLVQALGADGFVVDHCSDGEAAWFMGDTEDFAIAILDLGLPRLDGLSVLRRWRANGRNFPVLVLTARGEWAEKVEGIESGADDYLAKPFAMGELLARAKGLVRRAAGHASGLITIGALKLDTARKMALIDDRQVNVSQLEFRFLNYLAHQPDRVVSAGEIAEHLYGTSDGNETNAIEALVTRLRRKIGPDIIETRRGFGYLLANRPKS